MSGVLTIADTKGTSRDELAEDHLEGKQSLATLVGLSPRMYHFCHKGPNGDHVYFVREAMSVLDIYHALPRCLYHCSSACSAYFSIPAREVRYCSHC